MSSAPGGSDTPPDGGAAAAADSRQLTIPAPPPGTSHILVEYPGYVGDEQKVLETLGGTAGLARQLQVGARFSHRGRLAARHAGHADHSAPIVCCLAARRAPLPRRLGPTHTLPPPAGEPKGAAAQVPPSRQALPCDLRRPRAQPPSAAQAEPASRQRGRGRWGGRRRRQRRVGGRGGGGAAAQLPLCAACRFSVRRRGQPPRGGAG